LKYRLHGALGSFPYFGVRVHFPRGSIAFRAACVQGIFEAENVRALQQLYRPGTYMFDAGANLGLMAIPVLRSYADSMVVSFEPSPNSLPWLRRTIAGSGFQDRWRLVEKALAASPGRSEFSVAGPEEGLYDGLKSTCRVVEVRRITVDATTVDAEWQQLGQPPVSVIKLDVEGAEFEVLRGSEACIDGARPTLLLEWNRINLEAYGVEPGALFDFAKAHNYRVYAMPAIVPVSSGAEVELHSLRTETFLLAPAS
jgi:FkbM family methyltransferase